MKKTIIALAVLAGSLAATPAVAQQSSYKAGPVWSTQRIKVHDGQFQNYMDWLLKNWADNQAYAKSQGWILEYHILSNFDSREGEPDLILVTTYADEPTAAEAERRNTILNQRRSLDDHSADAASGDRTKMRDLVGSITYRELVKR